MRKKNLHAHQGSGNGVVYLPDIDDYKNYFKLRHNEICSWRKVAEPYEIHPSMARLISLGYDPGNRTREKLRLPNKEAVQVCEECGEVHVKGHPKNHRPRPPRIAIRLDDPPSAANTILNNMEPNNISMLIDLLNERRGNPNGKKDSIQPID